MTSLLQEFRKRDNETHVEKIKFLLTVTDLQSELLWYSKSGPSGRLGKAVQVPRQQFNRIF